jgi:phosphomethylpyrimidine synthase
MRRRPYRQRKGGVLSGGALRREAERGMAEMSEKFKAMGNEVYVEAVKESNKAL